MRAGTKFGWAYPSTNAFKYLYTAPNVKFGTMNVKFGYSPDPTGLHF